ncbi:hypothetical protein BT69DRAFT_1113916 [Atractiella rhizophila]|nr:hypothetical protein BT69DRAFT_1113916 [Atractiella rhizophila]
MPPKVAAGGERVAKRKRQRKRRRRDSISSHDFDTSSSSSEASSALSDNQDKRKEANSSESEEESDSSTKKPAPVPSSASKATALPIEEEDDDLLPEESESVPYIGFSLPSRLRSRIPKESDGRPILWGFVNGDTDVGADAGKDQKGKEKENEEAFKKWYLDAVVSAFSDEIATLQEEKNLSSQKLNHVVDALASGAALWTHNDEDDKKSSLFKKKEEGRGDREIVLEGIGSSRNGNADGDVEMAV